MLTHSTLPYFLSPAGRPEFELKFCIECQADDRILERLLRILRIHSLMLCTKNVRNQERSITA